MGIISSIKSGLNSITSVRFSRKMNKLIKNSDSQTVVFTNVRRVDDVAISSYAIDAALDDNSPVWLLSDQGKILLTKAASDVNIPSTIVPPIAGEYILICDYAATRTDFRGRHFSYTREPKLISDDSFAYVFDAEDKTLSCTANADAVDLFKEILEYRKTKAAPELSRITIEIFYDSKRDSKVKFYYTEFGIYVDGVKLGNVEKGKSKIFAVTEGTHELKIKTFFSEDHSKPLSFDIAYDQHLKFSCGYTKIARWIPFPCPFIDGIEVEKIN